jgi:hypothetical protein
VSYQLPPSPPLRCSLASRFSLRVFAFFSRFFPVEILTARLPLHTVLFSVLESRLADSRRPGCCLGLHYLTDSSSSLLTIVAMS